MGQKTSKASGTKPLLGKKAKSEPHDHMLDTLNTDTVNFTFGDMRAIVEKYNTAKGADKTPSTVMKQVNFFYKALSARHPRDTTHINIVSLLRAIYPGLNRVPAANIISKFKHDYEKHTRKKSTVGPMGPKTRDTLQDLYQHIKDVGIATLVIDSGRRSRLISNTTLLKGTFTFFSAEEMPSIQPSAAPAPKTTISST